MEVIKFIFSIISFFLAVLAAYHGFNSDWNLMAGFLILASLFKTK